MKPRSNSLLKASAIAIALLGSAAIVGAIAFPDAAYAKGGNGNGNGNGGGNGGGKGGGNDGGEKSKGNGSGASKGKGHKAVGKSAGKSSGSSKNRTKSSKKNKFSLKNLLGGNRASSKTKKPTRTARSSQEKTLVTTSVRPTQRPKKSKISDLLGVHPSELGALNAANASEAALNNAAPNSRVGRIATYRDTVLAGEEIRTELEEKQAVLDGLTPPDRPISEIDEDLAASLTDVEEKQTRVTELEQELADAGGTDADIEAELADANAELQESIDTADDLSAERDAAVEYDETVTEVEELTDAVENQDLTEREALEAAANKPVTDEVEDAVKALLGLDLED